MVKVGPAKVEALPAKELQTGSITRDGEGK
jgi:hypothetical protein